jgi:hypothetical protein
MRRGPPFGLEEGLPSGDGVGERRIRRETGGGDSGRAASNEGAS